MYTCAHIYLYMFRNTYSCVCKYIYIQKSPANIWIVKAQGSSSDIEASFTALKAPNQIKLYLIKMKKISTIVGKFKTNRNIQFEISNIRENLVCSWTPEKSWKKMTLETVKKCCTNLKFVKISSTPYSRDTFIKNAVVLSSIRTSLWSACV